MFLGTPASLSFYATLLFSKRIREDAKFNARLEKEVSLTKFKVETVKDMFNDPEGLYKFTVQNIKAAGVTLPCTWSDLTEAEREDLLWQRQVENTTPWSLRKSLKHGKTVNRLKGPEREFFWPPPRNNNFNSWPPADKIPYKHLQDPRTRMTPCTIALSSRLFSDLKFQRRSPKQSLKNNFGLAAIICHELAHAVEQGRSESRERRPEEPKFPHAELSELGHQFSMCLYGGCPCESTLHPKNYKTVLGSSPDRDGMRDVNGKVLWLVFRDWPLRSTSPHYFLPLDYIARVQRQEFWDAAAQADNMQDQSLCHFPKRLGLSDSAERARRAMDRLLENQGRSGRGVMLYMTTNRKLED